MGVYFITHLIKILGMPGLAPGMGVCTGAINPNVTYLFLYKVKPLIRQGLMA